MAPKYSRHPSIFFTAVAFLLGAAALTASTFASPLPVFEPRFLLLAFCATTAGTLLYLKVPRAELLVVPLSSVFVVLAAALYGTAAAVTLATATALVSSLRLSRRGRLLVCDVSLTAVATFCWTSALPSLGGLFAYGLDLSPAIAALTYSLAQAAAQTVLAPFLVVGGVAGRSTGTPLKSLARVTLTYAPPTLAAALVSRVVPVESLDASLLVVAAGSAALAVVVSYRRGSGVDKAVAVVAPSSGARVLQAAFDHAAIGMALLSSKGKLLRVNRSLCSFLGYTESELMCSSLRAVTQEEDLAPALAALRSMLRQDSGFLQIEVRHRRRGGEPVWALWNVARFRDAGDGETYLILQLQDITERKQSEERLRHDAFHDALTGLPNRALFADHVKLTIARAHRREGALFAVLFCDLDRFKVINDSLGHMVGDQLLVEVSRRLEACLRQGDTVARVGGDEFTILLEDLADEAEAIAIAERVQSAVSMSINLSGREVFTTLSIGLAVTTGGYQDPEDILRDADTAMYRAKSLGKARHVVFDHSMHASAINLLQIETDLRKGLEKRQFFLLYQPIVSLDNFKLCGFEALVRWHHPERGLISPLDFIPVAEETGQIIAIGEWALREACRRMRAWDEKYPSASPLFISVNLSAKQFNHHRLIELVADVLGETGLNPRSLKLEITESAVMENIDTATDMLRQLRDLGVKLAIDDFGTGYSSLSYLHRFPIDTLKIDRSFVTRMADNTENIEIVRTIVMLAQVLGMEVVAEGVETKEQLKLLRDLKCEYGQGYYFSRPSSELEAEKIIIETDEHLRKVYVTERAAEALAGNRAKTLRLVE